MNTADWLVTTIGVVLYVFGVLILVRNSIVYKARTQRLNEITAANHADIEVTHARLKAQVAMAFTHSPVESMTSISQRTDEQWQAMEARTKRRWRELEDVGYGKMMMDLRRWRYKQFYPKEVV